MKESGNRLKDQLKIINNRGSALIVSLIILVILSLIGLASLQLSLLESKTTDSHKAIKDVFQAAEAGYDSAMTQIYYMLANQSSQPDTIILQDLVLPGFNVALMAVPVGPMENKLITKGPFAGLNGNIRSYNLTSKADSIYGQATATTSGVIDDQLIPIFQFAIFYQGNLEINSATTMTVNGRVHSNSKIFMDPADLTLNDPLTSAGGLHNHRAPGDPAGHQPNHGPIKIDNGKGQKKNMTYDTEDSNWKSKSLADWNGRVLDLHNTTPPLQPITPPLSDPGDPWLLIKDGNTTDTQSFYFNAAVIYKFLGEGNAANGWYAHGGTTLLPTSGCAVNIVNVPYTANIMRDGRGTGNIDDADGVYVNIIELDIGNLVNMACAINNALYHPVGGGLPGVLYISAPKTTNPLTAVRLTNGATLPSNGTTGFTVATENPLYIRGSYNSTAPLIAAAVAADSVTILSNSWTSSYDASSLIDPTKPSARPASDTTVNTAIMTGDVPTGESPSHYSGGVHNLIRFLESWNGNDFFYGGSVTCLWQSRLANGWYRQYNDSNSYYKPPNRTWTYNMDIYNMPPGTPQVQFLYRGIWTLVRESDS